MAFQVSEEVRSGRKVYHLRDTTTGASASILPESGFNLFDLKLPVGGHLRPILSSYPDFPNKPRDFGRNGIPILFPFPNRIRDAKYSYGGKDYTLPATNGSNAIHGFAISDPWDVVEAKVTDAGATIAGRYQISKNSPAMQPNWPTDGVLSIRYTLNGRTLTLEAEVSNPTAQPFPFGLGFHPYFHLPFTDGGDQARTKVIVPASKFWELDQFLPTGKIVDVPAGLDFRAGQPIKGLKLDDVLTGLAFEGDTCTCKLVDEALGAEFHLSFDKGFRELVVYTPPGDGDVISLEPYTQTTDAINLQTKGVDAGLRVLGHGEMATFKVVFQTVG
ncbi:aldose 1-epimerase [Isosphaeraceae bacterium EP7]